MGPVRRKILMDALKVFDLVLMAVSFALAPATVLYHRGLSIGNFFEMRVKLGNFLLFSLFLLAWHAIFSAFGLYQSRRLSSRRREVVDILKATSLGTFFAFFAATLFHIRMLTPSVLGTFWLVSSILVISGRLILRFLLERTRLHGRNLRSMLIVGTNSRAVEFARRIESKPELGYRIIGFVDDSWPGMKDFELTGYRLECDLGGLPQFLREAVVDEVVIALPIRSFYMQASRVAALCEEQGIITRFLSSLFDLKLARSKAEEFAGDFLITHYTGSLEGWPAIVKRALDCSVSLILVALLSPLFLLVGLLIKLTSPGPVFFRQKRLGLNKRAFYICKFRTMVPDAERKLREVEHLNEVTGPVFKIKNDPRITPIGRFLRKTSVDELPQLLNVLKGDMSLVGPRPLPVRDYEGFDQDWQRRRFSIRPGITCLWQVNGRSCIPFEKWMELDMQYIDEWSLWLDFRILLKTIPAVLKGSGAT